MVFVKSQAIFSKEMNKTITVLSSAHIHLQEG